MSAPILFVTGERDSVNHKTVYRTGFEMVASETKGFRCFPGYGHLDLAMGLEARRTVFPYVADWLDSVA